MQIAKNAVVTIDYTLTDEAGEVVDTSQGREPLSYIQGTGSIIPGLESALEGKAAGDSLEVSIPPEQAYGPRQDALVVQVPRERFESADEVKPGMQFQTQTESGVQVITVVAVDGENVTVDANHPLAGATLNFAVSVVGVRDATAEELEHGHVHEAGAHGH